MSVIITDEGFGQEDFDGIFTPLEDYLVEREGAPGTDDAGTPEALDVPSSADLAPLAGKLEGLRLIRIDFPSFADGRGFTLAHRLRMMGFTGRLRARGHVLADQYTMARRSGFDEVEIEADLAVRQPEDQWRYRADWKSLDYRARMHA